MIKFINSFGIMIFWKNCLLIAWMLPKCVMGLSLSPEMTLIVSIAFGSLLLIIIIAVVIGCIYVWFTKKQDIDLIEDNSSSRRNRLRRLNSIHPGREISMAEFEYLHNKSRAEYAMMQGSNALPGYLDFEESTLHPEFRANNRRVSPPPPYDHNQERPDSVASVPLESDLPPLPSTKTSTSAPQNSALSTSSTRNNRRKPRSDTTTETKENDDVNSRTQSKKNQKASRIINVEDPDRLRLKKLSLANKIKHAIETGEGSSVQTVDSTDSCVRVSSEIERNITQDDQDNNDGYDESTCQHSRMNDKSPTMDRPQSKQMGNDEQRKSYRIPLSDVPLRDTKNRQNSPEQQPKSSRTSAVPQRYTKNDRFKTKEQPLRPDDKSPPIQHPKRQNDWVSDNSNARSRRSGSYQDDHGEDLAYGDHHQYQQENFHLNDNEGE